MHPAILYQLGYVIRVCKRRDVETSICGQAGSKKPMVKYLIEQGIDSISVNADAAKEISEYIKETEENSLKDTDKEPRQYQPEPSEETTQDPEKDTVEEPVINLEDNTSEGSSNQVEQSQEEVINENEPSDQESSQNAINDKNPSQESNLNNNKGFVEKIKEAVEETEEVVKELTDKVSPSEEEEFYHQALKQPKDFKEDELPTITGSENLEESKEENKEEKLDIF